MEYFWWILFAVSGYVFSKIYDIFELVLTMIGLGKFNVKYDRDKQKSFYKYLEKNNISYSELTHIEGKLFQSGYSFGKWYIAYANNNDSKYPQITIFCTKKQFDKIYDIDCGYGSDEDDEREEIYEVPYTAKIDKDEFITQYCVRPTEDGIYYNKKKLYTRLSKPSPYQKAIMNKIDHVYSENDGICTVYLYGEKETGKTGTAYLYAKQYKNAKFVDTYDPTKAGYSFSQLVDQNAEPTYDKPLIILFDEVDKMLERVHNEQIINKINMSSKNSFYEISDKRSWNQFFDRLNYSGRGIIIIMTSNLSLQEMNKKLDGDESYLRDGRVNLAIEMYKDKEPNITYMENPIIKYNRMFEEENKIKED